MPHDTGTLSPSLPYLPRPILRGPSVSKKTTPHLIRTLSLQHTCLPNTSFCLTAAHAPSWRFFPEYELPIHINTSFLPTLDSVISCRQCVFDLHTSDKRAFSPHITGSSKLAPIRPSERLPLLVGLVQHRGVMR